MLVRRHNKLDGTNVKQLVADAKFAAREGQPITAIVLVAGWGIKTFVLPSLVGTVGLICVAFITHICSGLTFEQVQRLLCIAGEIVRGKPLQSCVQTP